MYEERKSTPVSQSSYSSKYAGIPEDIFIPRNKIKLNTKLHPINIDQRSG